MYIDSVQLSVGFGIWEQGSWNQFPKSLCVLGDSCSF